MVSRDGKEFELFAFQQVLADLHHFFRASFAGEIFRGLIWIRTFACDSAVFQISNQFSICAPIDRYEPSEVVMLSVSVSNVAPVVLYPRPHRRGRCGWRRYRDRPRCLSSNPGPSSACRATNEQTDHHHRSVPNHPTRSSKVCKLRSPRSQANIWSSRCISYGRASPAPGRSGSRAVPGFGARSLAGRTSCPWGSR